MNYSYIIKWLGSRSWEEIDEADNRAEAERLVQEYNLAFHGGRFKIIKKKKQQTVKIRIYQKRPDKCKVVQVSTLHLSGFFDLQKLI